MSDFDEIELAKFNSDVERWARSIRSKIASGAAGASQGKTINRKFPTTASSVSVRVVKFYGIANKIKFSMPPKGIFMEYGVGRGYPRPMVKSGTAMYKGFGPEGRKERPFVRPVLSANIDSLKEIVEKGYSGFAEASVKVGIETKDGEG
jgi:hypothetical protein